MSRSLFLASGGENAEVHFPRHLLVPEERKKRVSRHLIRRYRESLQLLSGQGGVEVNISPHLRRLQGYAPGEGAVQPFISPGSIYTDVPVCARPRLQHSGV